VGDPSASWVEMIDLRFLISCTLFLVCGVLYGQEPKLLDDLNVSEESENNETIAITPVRTSQSETITQAGEDLRFGKVGERVGAAKLLGKYPSQYSSAMLVGALDDQDPLVRRSAMVSLTEHARNGFPLYDTALVEKVFSKLGDPDVEVRREVSSMIPRLSSGLTRSKVEMVEINGNKQFRTLPGSMRSDLKVLSARAFLDEDAIVRQNLLKYHQYLRIAIPPDALVRLLSDSDLGVLLEALGKIYSNASHPVVVNKIKDLATHTNKGIRLKVIDVARDSNRYHPDYRSILRSITKDPDSEVACMAAVELARFGETLSSEVVNNIKDYLLNARGMNSSVTTILYAVSAMGKDAIAIYSALTKHSSSQMRGVAWQRYLNLVKGWDKPEFWLPALNDRDGGVREKVLLSLRGRVSQLDVDEVKVLVGSKYSDVRIFAGQSFLSAEKEAIDQYGFDLLIDENSIVRATTIRAMGARRLPGWLKIMSRSLLDDDYVIQRAAMDALLGDHKEGLEELKKYVVKYPQSRISSLARAELNRKGVMP